MKTVELGRRDYLPVFEAMKRFNDSRSVDTEDELWVVEHNPVFTQGLAGKAEHLLDAADIPVVYTMIDFKRRKTSVRHIVSALENSIIATLAAYGIASAADPQRPGVYVDGKKIASLGLRIKNGSVYHGLALNVDMDLAPFAHINPCGYAGLQMTQIADLVSPCPTLAGVADKLTALLDKNLATEAV